MKRILALILLITLLTACGGTRDARENPNWRVGTQGAVMRFLPNLPPPRLYDDSQLSVVLEVFNRGAFPLGPNDRIYLSGFDPAYITGISTYGVALEESEGLSNYNSEGTAQFVSFEGIPVKLGNRRVDRLPMTLLATACYTYQTTASVNVCIDMDPFSPTAQQRICTPLDVGGGTQGAPVAVNNVEVDAAPGRTRFTIHVSNVGPGEPFRPGFEYQQHCSPYDPVGFKFGELDMVRLNDVQISGRSIIASCKPLEEGNLVRLINGQGKIFCDFRDSRANPAYVSPLIVTMEYGYRQSIQVPIEIVASD